jgi:hypothetical protein
MARLRNRICGDPLNLIRVMPAKGQDMTTSIFLAELMGPVCLVIGLALFLNGEGFRALLLEFIDSPVLIFLSGIVTMAGGLAIVLTHNIWAADWRVVITLIGWLATIGGAIRIVIPQQTIEIGRTMLTNIYTLPIVMGFYVVIGALLTYFGYRSP